MRKRRRVLIGCACLTVAIVLVTCRWLDQEPRYMGRTLGEWVDRYYAPTSPTEAAAALAAIGTNALPHLLGWMKYETPKWKESARASNRMPKWIRGWLGLARPTRAHVRAVASAKAFRALRAVADPAIPELKRRAVLTNARLTKSLAVGALVQIGSEAAIDAITSQDLDGDARITAAHYAGRLPDHFGSNTMRIVSWISDNASHTNLGVRHISVRALGDMHIEPETVVPLLTTKVSDPEPVVRMAAVEALGKFGRQAHAAVPALLQALQDPQEPMRRTVANALNAIGAQALTNAPGE